MLISSVSTLFCLFFPKKDKEVGPKKHKSPEGGALVEKLALLARVESLGFESVYRAKSVHVCLIRGCL